MLLHAWLILSSRMWLILRTRSWKKSENRQNLLENGIQILRFAKSATSQNWCWDPMRIFVWDDSLSAHCNHRGISECLWTCLCSDKKWAVGQSYSGRCKNSLRCVPSNCNIFHQIIDLSKGFYLHWMFAQNSWWTIILSVSECCLINAGLSTFSIRDNWQWTCCNCK